MRRSRWPSLLAIALIVAAAPAGAQGFGQNKVQYKNLKWSIIETDNFEVYFYEGQREAAMDAARMAERAYARLSTILRHEIEEKVPLILYGSHADFQSTNVLGGMIGEGTGGFTEFLKRRVSLPFTGGYGDLDHVLTHELVHAFQVDLLFGKGDRGLGNPFGVYTPPLWFMEGMSEYLSVTRVDEHTRMWMRDAALQGYLIPLEHLNRVYDIRVYRFGQSIFAYIGRTFGDERIGELLKRVCQTRNLERAFQDVLGMTVEKFSEDWMQDVRRTYLPEIREYQKPEEFARRITDSQQDLAGYHLAPALSPDGTRLAFFSDRSLHIDLYLASALDGKVERRLVKGSRTEAFESLRFLSASVDFSPDGEHLAVAAKVGGSDAIYLLRVRDGAVVRKIQFDLDGIGNPSFSPDGESIVFSGLQGGRSNLYLCRSDGSGLRRLTDDRFLASAPRFAPDGRRIVFITDEHPSTDFENLIFASPRPAILDLDGGAVQVLDAMEGKNAAPHFFPDGRHLLYVSDRTGISNLFIRDLETGRDAQITNILTGVTGIIPLAPAVSLSRDGGRLAFTAFTRGTWDIFAMKDPLARADFTLPEGPPAPARSPRIEDFVSAEPAALPAPAPETGADGRDADGGGADTEEPEGEDAEGDAPADPQMQVRFAAADSTQSPPPPLKVGEVFSLHRELPDTNDFSIDRYRVRFSIDYAAANGFFASNVGLAAQTVLRFSDVLGNHNLIIGASVYGSIADSDLLFQYVNLARRINYGIALYQIRDDFFLTTAEDRDEFVSQIYRGFDVTLSRPFSRFRRIDLNVEGLQVDEKVYQEAFGGTNLYFSEPTEENDLYFVRPGIAYVTDNTLYGITGPISGGRSRYSADVSFGDLSTSRFLVDRRLYWNIRQRHALALRTVGATSHGRDPQVYRIGGPWTVRGYDYGEFAGNHIGLANLEFRFPLIEAIQFGWPLPLGLRSIRGSLFIDAGAAWYDHEQFRAFRKGSGSWHLEDIHASWGLGASINIGFAVLRWDLAQPTDLGSRVRPWRGTFTIGSDF